MHTYKISTRNKVATLVTNEEGIKAVIDLLKSLNDDKVEIYVMQDNEFILVTSLRVEVKN